LPNEKPQAGGQQQIVALQTRQRIADIDVAETSPAQASHDFNFVAEGRVELEAILAGVADVREERCGFR